MDVSPIDRIHAWRVNGLEVRSGDLLFTRDGGDAPFTGQFWWVVGKLLPGEADHVVVYAGPGGRCVEAGATGKVIAFEAVDPWQAAAMFAARGFLDRLHGAGSPLAGRGLPAGEEEAARLDVANYCLEQARDKKPYNLNFLDSETEQAFYCSQLAYKAYQRRGVNLNTGMVLDRGLPWTKSIIYPQEVWEGCADRRRA